MNNDTFDKFWNESISPSIELCLKEISYETKKYIKLKETNKKEYKEELENLYRHKREWLKKEYLPSEGPNAILDFHKLSVIICRSIIGNKYFSFSEQKANELFEQINRLTIPKKEKLKKEIDSIYINYKLAFYVAGGINYLELLAKAAKKRKNENDENKIVAIDIFIEKLTNYSELYKYSDNGRHDDLKDSLIIALMKNDLLVRDFDYLAYSAIMYQWQEYTKSEICFDILYNGQSNLASNELRELIMSI